VTLTRLRSEVARLVLVLPLLLSSGCPVEPYRSDLGVEIDAGGLPGPTNCRTYCLRPGDCEVAYASNERCPPGFRCASSFQCDGGAGP
jgi:hypothetical protein